MKDITPEDAMQGKSDRTSQKCFGSNVLDRWTASGEAEAVQNLIMEGFKKCKTLA
jgi:hypothetical protein